MASINYATREISCKIVYYGPGLSGKTTNLQIIHRKIPDKDKSEMVSLATETDRTLFFDFLPLDLGSIKGFSTKFQLYTVPGQVYYNATRKLVLRGVDGVVFVVDSQVDKLQENLESFANLQENLREYGHAIENIPLVLQFNKRDLPNIYPVDQLNSLVNKHGLPYYEAVAATGVGVFTTLKAIGKSVIDKFNAKYAGFQGATGRRPAARPEAPAARAAPPAAPPPGQPLRPQPPRPAPQAGFPGPGGFPPRPAPGAPPFGMPAGAPAPGGFQAPAANPFQGGGFGAPQQPGMPQGFPPGMTNPQGPGPSAPPNPFANPIPSAQPFGAPRAIPVRPSPAFRRTRPPFPPLPSGGSPSAAAFPRPSPAFPPTPRARPSPAAFPGFPALPVRWEAASSPRRIFPSRLSSRTSTARSREAFPACRDREA